MIINDNTLEIYETICISCANYDGACQCKAFPDGIPDDIVEGAFKHTKPYKGDNGIQYEKNPEGNNA